MTLHEFLSAQQQAILSLCASKLASASTNPTIPSPIMQEGLAIFYQELIEVLRADEHGPRPETDQAVSTPHRVAAVRCGKESLRLGYTISQVVHGYGALCQSITEYAEQHPELLISAREFNRLNFCLDVAIAEAVTEFSSGRIDKSEREEVQRLGFLAHELRNALTNASLAHMSIKSGLVGVGGHTSKVLEDAISNMKSLIDRSLSEVRSQAEPNVYLQKCRVIDMVGEAEIAAIAEARVKSIRLHVSVPVELEVIADRQLAVSAISNLIQNAIKFTRQDGNVWIRGSEAGAHVLIEIEDQCGGLPPGATEELFKPYSQKGADRSGLGLGLPISRRAMELNKGEISVKDLPGQGCVFTIQLPRSATAVATPPVGQTLGTISPAPTTVL